jgi:hypothetical protein
VVDLGVSGRSHFKVRKQAGLMDSMKHLFTIIKTVINHNSFDNLFFQRFVVTLYKPTFVFVYLGL